MTRGQWRLALAACWVLLPLFIAVGVLRLLPWGATAVCDFASKPHELLVSAFRELRRIERDRAKPDPDQYLHGMLAGMMGTKYVDGLKVQAP